MQRRARCPLDRALDRRGQAGVDPVAGEQEARRPASRSTAAPAGRARARTSRAARGRRSRAAAARRGRRAARRAARRAPRRISSSLVSAEDLRRAARDQRQMRRARRRTPARLSNTHCIARPGRPTNGSSRTRRSNQRFTVTIGDEAMRARAIERRRAAPAARRRTARPARTTARAEITRVGRPRLAADVDAGDARRRGQRDRRGRRRCAPSPPWRSMNSRAGSAYIRCSGLVGSAIAAARGSSPNISASTRANGGAAACSRRLVQRRQRQRIPQHLAQPRRLAVANQPVLDRLVRATPPSPSRPAAARGARSSAASPSAAPTGDRATTARPTRARRRPGAAAPAAPGSSSRVRRPARSIIVTASCGSSADVVAARRCRAGTRTSPCSSPSGRAGRCRRARRSRDRETRSRGRRAAPALRARARARRCCVSRTAALRPAKPAPMTIDVVARSRRSTATASARSAPAAACGTRARAREHVVAAALDPLQRLEVHRPHDLGGDEPPAILGRHARRSRADRSRARGGTRTRAARRTGSVTTPAARSSTVQPHAAQILERQVDAAALEIALDVAQDVGQLQRDAEVQRVVARAGRCGSRRCGCRSGRPPTRRGGSTRTDRRTSGSASCRDPSRRRR